MTIANQSKSSLATLEQAENNAWGPIGAVLLTVAIYFVSQIIALEALSIYAILRGWGETRTEVWFKTSTVAQTMLILFVEALVVAMVLGLLKIKKQRPKDIGIVKPKPRDALYAISALGIYFILYIALFIVIKLLFPHVNFDGKQDVGFESAKHGTQLVLVFFSLVILPPIGEEILCRGFLYTGLRKKLALWPAAVITSLLFASAHLFGGTNTAPLWAASIDTFVLSMVLVYLREITGSLAASMGVHMLKNFVAFMLLFIFVVR